MYEATDKIIAYLVKRIVRVFNNARLIKNFDELNTMTYVKNMYSNIDTFVRETYELLAKDSFAKGIEIAKDDEDTVEDLVLENKFNYKELVEEMLTAYDPVTNYRYDYEIERKRDRFVEAVISTKGDEKEFKKALKYLSNMVSQYAIEITRNSYIESFKALGVKKVKWVTQGDDKVCPKCQELDGKIFSIDEVPPLQHWNCRCTLEPVEE